MRRITPSVYLGISVFLGILAGTVFITAGCSQKAADLSASLTEVTSTVPTGPDEVFEVRLGSSELLKDLLDFKWQDVPSMTLIKYQDSIKVSTVTIHDREKLASIEDLFNKTSVIHKATDTISVPDENIVYEIYLNTQLSEDGSTIFLSIGPLYEDQTFAIGGTFIKAQSLDPRIRLMQTNQFVTFTEVKNVFDPMLEEPLYQSATAASDTDA